MPRLLAALLALVWAVPALATWKPEYDNEPQAVHDWFAAAIVPGGYGGEAYKHLRIVGCCEQAERLRTKFVALDGHQWNYYPDPTCTVKGCTLLPIPDYVVHDDPIRALDPKDDTLPQFNDMRREGVLFIYENAPSCFWPPDESGG